jgi:hypothetical protein
MPITLDKVFPWGRSLREYTGMFALTDDDLKSRILDCGGGPASFNAELSQRGGRAVSCDPIYNLAASEIAQRIEETCPIILAATTKASANFVWREIQSVAHLESMRRSTMQKFLEDFPQGLGQNRYMIAELPALPFADHQFDLALCSHLLFTYGSVLTLEFHIASIRELCRVACEARIFPLFPNFGSEHSPYLPAVMEALESEGYAVAVRRVPYEFQKGGNEMLCVSQKQPRTCARHAQA